MSFRVSCVIAALSVVALSHLAAGEAPKTQTVGDRPVLVDLNKLGQLQRLGKQLTQSLEKGNFAQAARCYAELASFFKGEETPSTNYATPVCCQPCVARVAPESAAPISTSIASILGNSVPDCVQPKKTSGLVTRTYQVVDLVVPIDAGPSTNLLRVANNDNAKPERKRGDTLEAQLIKLITNSVAPHSWSSVGGPGMIDYFPLGMALVINQTPEVHEQIVEFLTALRRLQDVEVAVEVRIARVPDDVFSRLGLDFKPASLNSIGLPPSATVTRGPDGMERIGIEFNHVPATDLQAIAPRAASTPAPPHGDCPANAVKVTILKDIPRLKRLLETIQEDRRSNVMQAPKLTVFNGQASTINITDTKWLVTGLNVHQKDGGMVFSPYNEPFSTGFAVDVRPAVSADRRSIHMNFRAYLCELAQAAMPLVQVTTLTSSSEGAVEKPKPFAQFLQRPKFNRLNVQKSFTLPDGGTAVLGGIRWERQAATESVPPILSKVPYVNRLFKNVGYTREAENLLVLVTPRILIAGEEEERKPQAASADAVVPAGYRPVCPCPEQLPAPPKSADPRVAELVKKYRQACADGRTAEATALAVKALALDPACFASRP